jgi:hypothetical protein
MTQKENIDNYSLVDSLPSGMISYPKGCKISVRPYTYGEAQNLKKSAATSTKLFYDNVLSGVRTSFDKYLLTPEDVLYLGIYRNLISSKHTQVVVEARCPHCKHKNKHVINLRDIKFKALEIEGLPVTAELDNYTVDFGLMTTKGYLQAIKEFDDDPLAALASQVTKIVRKTIDATTGELVLTELKYDEKELLETIRGVLAATIDEDRDVLDEVTDIFTSYGMKSMEVVCEDENCRQAYEINLEDRTLLVYPFRGESKSPRDRIKFGAK